MTIHTVGTRHERLAEVPFGPADWLCLAAAPTFAAAGLLTALLGGSAPDMLCGVPHASPLGGMAAMYLLMGAFHSAPWLKLIAARRGGPHRV